MEIGDLQRRVAGHDAEGWLHPPGMATDEHNLLHLIMTAGRLASHLEGIQDRQMPESVPLDPRVVTNLVIEALRLANNHGVDLGEAVPARLDDLRERNRQLQVSKQDNATQK